MTSIAGLAVLALVAVACQVPNPTPAQTVPESWGQGMTPPAHLRDIPYVSNAQMGCAGHRSDEHCEGSQTLDIYPATRGGNKGTIVLFHGGAFAFGDKIAVPHLGPIFRQTHRGYAVVSVNYRLLRNERNQFPTQVNDGAAALRWVKAHGASRGLNTNKVIVAGHSAGGTISTLLGTAWNSGRGEYRNIPKVDGWVSVAGISDCSAGWNSLSLCLIWMGPERIQHHAVASAQSFLDPSDPPGYIIHGDRDGIVEWENARRLKAKADNGGYGANVYLDTVDFYANGAAQPAWNRNHAPMSGANAAEFDAWLDAR